MTKEIERKKQLKSFARYSGLGIQIGVTIYLGNYLGVWLDEKYPNNQELYSKGITLLAVFLAIYNVIRQVTRKEKS